MVIWSLQINNVQNKNTSLKKTQTIITNKMTIVEDSTDKKSREKSRADALSLYLAMVLSVLCALHRIERVSHHQFLLPRRHGSYGSRDCLGRPWSENNGATRQRGITRFSAGGGGTAQ